ncbi:MAG: hypothetical protein EXR62_16625 [Chloroflexi bacterium]|nr:hypothetical protein [Chloroflexota bacterium]
MGLVARALEMAGIATVVTSWNTNVNRMVYPPRSTVTRLGRGATIGRPYDAAQQRRVLEATLALLSRPAPLDPVDLEES